MTKAICFVGEPSVGKTSIIAKQLGNTKGIQTTIGTDKTQMTVDGETFDVIDTAGQEAFHSLTMGEIRRSSIIVIVFDITDAETFEKIKSYWLDFIASIKLPSYFVIVGNKCDLANERAVAFSEGVSLSNQIINEHFDPSEIDLESEEMKHSTYIETSAVNGTGINNLFSLIAKKLKNAKETIQGVDLTKKDDVEQPKKCSC